MELKTQGGKEVYYGVMNSTIEFYCSLLSVNFFIPRKILKRHYVINIYWVTFSLSKVSFFFFLWNGRREEGGKGRKQLQNNLKIR